MELDVHLRRQGEESWGFRLIGGKDFNMPLTVVKVVPDSPAEKAGLQNGDAVCRINDRDTTDLSHDSAKQAVDDAADTLALAVKRGLYDPVLDDYEPIDQDDFDQPSQPTEVDPFGVQQFTDQRNNAPTITIPIPELRDIETPALTDATELQSRSLTASPFVLPTKPYRPFSTEPLPVPPLEDPIILNPNYKDQFGKFEDGEVFPETKFKLPISEQYDPDGTRRKGKTYSKTSKEITFETCVKKDVSFEERVKKETKISEEMQHKSMVDEVKFMEKMKKDIDLDKIEMTAVSLVEESIDKAVSVASEIKKEIDGELSESVVSSETKEAKITNESKSTKEAVAADSMINSEKSSKAATELVDLIDKTTEEIVSYNDSKSEVKVAEEVEKFESYQAKEHDEALNERKLSTKKEIEESIESGSVRRKSEAFDKTAQVKSVDVDKSAEKRKVSETQVKDKITAEKYVEEKVVKEQAESVRQSTEKASEVKKESVSSSQKSGVKTESKTSKHRAYTIGLQTIPNIKGTIHSSYHYNLLLKTFFIHLTDVMVALSRFILTEPVFNKEETEEKTDVTSSETTSEYVSVKDEKLIEQAVVSESQKDHKDTAVDKQTIQEVKENKQEEKQIAEAGIVTEQQTVVVEKAASAIAKDMKVIEYGKAEDIKEYLEVEQASETRMLSGAKMAQLTERKSEELTQKMEAVITEFETKAGIEASAEVRERRSRSRSRIEEEVAKESDPLQWLSKVDKLTQELTQVKTESKSFSSSTESVEKKRTETIEKHESKTSKTKEGKQMYVAIVESHVFTNKDAIFEEQLGELSETSSVKSVEVDAVNVAVQASETVASEKVLMENKDIKHEAAETVLEESRELAIVNSQTQMVEMKKDVKGTVEEVKAVEVDDKKVVQEIAVQQIIEPVIEIQELKTVNISEDIEKVDIKEEDHKMFVSQKTEYSVEEASDEIVHESKREEQAISIVEEAIHETAITSAKEEIREVETEKAVEVVSTDLSIAKPVEIVPTKDEASAALKIIKEQVLEVEQNLKLTDESELLVNKHTDIMETENFTASRKSVMKSSESKQTLEESSFTAKLPQQTQESSFTANMSEQVQESSFTAKMSGQMQESTFIAKSSEQTQESSFTAKSSMQSKKLALQLDLGEQPKLQSQTSVSSGPPSTIDTPTPATVPPTPLTDEYVFKLQIPLPKTTTIIPRDCTPTPEDEDPHIVKKKLIPHIDTTLDSPIIYDPPLPTPPGDKVQSPVYTKPGLRGGADRREFRRVFAAKKKEEILEIERKSTLLASAIDETIKCIEEYKEEVGIDTKKEVKIEETTKMEKPASKTVEEQKTLKQEINTETVPIIYNGFTKVETKVYNSVQNHDNQIEDEWNHIDEQVKDSNEKLNEISLKVNGAVTEKEIEAKTESQHEESRVTETAMKQSNNTTEPEITENLVNGNIIEETDNKPAIVDIEPTPAEVTVVIDPPPAIFKVEEKKDPLEGYRPIQFNPEELIAAKKNLQSVHLSMPAQMQRATSPGYVGPSGELLGTHQGIVDSLEQAVVDAEVAKELGKPGMTEEKIAELISGESEMLREAHVMGLSRVLKSHMHRADDDSSVDFKKIKPIIESLKDSEVLKALNDELKRTQEEKKKEEEKKWTTFLQKPSRPVPRAKFGYYGYIEPEVTVEEPYKVKIVKQPKPKVAPDYKPEDFETGPLPWEERAMKEPPPPPVDAEDPILVPEEIPEFLEAVDPLPESEVPDLEETGILLPPPKTEEPQEDPASVVEDTADPEEEPQELDIEAVVEETEKIVEEMEQNRLAEQLLSGVQSMVDPNASVDQQLAQMRAQLAALAQLPNVIQQTLDLVTRQLSQLSHQESHEVAISQTQSHMETVEETQETVEVTEIQTNGIQEETEESNQQPITEETVTNEPIVTEETKPSMTEEEREKLKKEEEEMLEEQRRIEKQKKELEQMRIEQEGRQVKQRPTPRVGKPKPVFGPPVPVERPIVLTGGRKWRKPQDAYNEQFIAETLSAQAEIIQGKAIGSQYESDILPYDERINFMKYEKPPVSLDHLQQSETYKLIHNMEQTPPKRVEMRTPVIAEADYREKCRSVTPAHMNMPQQVHP